MIAVMILKLRNHHFVSTSNMCINERQEARPEADDMKLNIISVHARQRSIIAARDSSKLLPFI
jgi:hypothetical protein